MTWSCFYGKDKMVKALLDKGISATEKDKRGVSPLFAAAQGSKNGVFKDGHHNEDIAELLFKHGASANEKNNAYFVIHIAAGKGKPGFVKLLLDKGANPKVKDKYKKTVADHAAKVRNEKAKQEILKLLKQ